MRHLYIQFLFLSLVGLLSLPAAMGQADVIELQNPSFEDYPRSGDHTIPAVRGWWDCGLLNFPMESPPDVQPSPDTGNLFFKVNIRAQHGNTYMGMVVRENDSWESLSQRLPSPMLKGKCYQFTINLCRSATYVSQLRDRSGEVNFTKPAVLRIWGGQGYCRKGELLAESPEINNTDWQAYVFEMNPTQEVNFIILEAFYKTPTLMPYNGNVLMDNASPIYLVSCPGEEEIIAEAELDPPAPPRRTNVKPKEQGSEQEKVAVSKSETEKPKSTKPKLIEGLERDKIKVGQTIRIDRLFFEADEATITKESFPVLDEIAEFMGDNQDVIIEVGGHTNTIPEHDYCDSLSTKRAKAVYNYLIEEGVPNNRLEYKGYGKREPLTFGRTAEAQKRNQRVEIKILSIEG